MKYMRPQLMEDIYGHDEPYPLTDAQLQFVREAKPSDREDLYISLSEQNRMLAEEPHPQFLSD